MKATRETLLKEVSRCGLDWGDEDDAAELVDVLLETFTPLEAQTWLFMHDPELDGIPMAELEVGRGRAVRLRARRIVADHACT